MISVVIPLYNKRSTIVRAVRSVLSQSATVAEIIVIDDGSGDEGAELVATEFGDSVRIVRQANAGVSAARNAGVWLSTSKWIAFLDADDFWLPGHIEAFAAEAGRSPSMTIWGSAYFAEDEFGIRTIRRLPDNLLTISGAINYFECCAEGRLPYQTSSVVASRSALMAVGGFPLGVRSGEDLITWARLACLGEARYSADPQCVYGLPPISAGNRRLAIRRPQQPDVVGLAYEELLTSERRYAGEIQRTIGAWARIRATLFMELGETRLCLHEIKRARRFSGIQLRDVATTMACLIPAGLRTRAVSSVRRLRRSLAVN